MFYPDPLPQIPEINNAFANNNLNPRLQPKLGFEQPFKTPPLSSPNCASFPNLGYSSNETATNTASQYLYTTPKTTMFTPKSSMYNSSRTPEKYSQNSFVVQPGDVAGTDRTKQGQRPNSHCLNETTVEVTASHSQPIVTTSVTNELKRPKVTTSNQCNLICRNFPAPIDDSKRKNSAENVRTFAQIVAATVKPSALPASNAKNEYFR